MLTPYPKAPELCVEIVSPSNSEAEIAEKVALYLETGAHEVWVIYEDRRLDIFNRGGAATESGLAPDVASELF